MNVVVVVLRGCPVGVLGPYGNEWVATPHLDRLAAEAVVFDRHVSDCPDPAAFRAAWRTGRHQVPPMAKNISPQPPPLGREGGQETIGLPSSPPPFLGEGPGEGLRPPPADLLYDLRAAGVHTVYVRANHPDTDLPADADGWAEVVDARPQADDPSPLHEFLRVWPPLLDRLAAVPRWLVWVETDRLLPPWDVPQDVFEAYLDVDGEDDEDDDPDAAEFAGPATDVEDADIDHFDDGDGDADEIEEPDADEPDDEDEDDEDGEPDAEEPDADDGPVTPWADPPVGPFDRADADAWEWLHSSVAAVVTALDAELGRAFAALRDRGLDGSAAWVVTSDFGWPLGEHGQVGPHRPALHEEFVHVPLVVRLPGAAEAGRRVPALTQPADVGATLRELLGVAPSPADGVSLVPLATGAADAVRPVAVSGLVLDGIGGWAVRTPEWTLLLADDPARGPQLFAQPDDRWESNDVRQHHLDLADKLEAELRATTDRRPPV